MLVLGADTIVLMAALASRPIFLIFKFSFLRDARIFVVAWALKHLLNRMIIFIRGEKLPQ